VCVCVCTQPLMFKPMQKVNTAQFLAALIFRYLPAISPLKMLCFR
jgi:hypothetical protein